MTRGFSLGGSEGNDHMQRVVVGLSGVIRFLAVLLIDGSETGIQPHRRSCMKLDGFDWNRFRIGSFPAAFSRLLTPSI